MLVIRDDQFEAIGEAAVRRRKEVVYERLIDEHGEFDRRVFEAMFVTAIQMGYRDEEQIFRVCRLAPFLGDADPEHPMVAQIAPELTSALMGADSRLKFVEAEVMPRVVPDAWCEAPPEPPSPTMDIKGARTKHDVRRGRLQVDFPEANWL